MISLLLGTLVFAAPPAESVRPIISYKKQVRVDPNYKSSHTSEEIRKSLRPAPRPVVRETVVVREPARHVPRVTSYSYAPSYSSCATPYTSYASYAPYVSYSSCYRPYRSSYGLRVGLSLGRHFYASYSSGHRSRRYRSSYRYSSYGRGRSYARRTRSYRYCR